MAKRFFLAICVCSSSLLGSAHGFFFESVVDKAVTLRSEQASNIEPEELCSLLSREQPNYTSLQRQARLENIIGEVVEWELIVSEVRPTDRSEIVVVRTVSCSPHNSEFIKKAEESFLSAAKSLGEVGAMAGRAMKPNRKVETEINVVILSERDKKSLMGIRPTQSIRVKGRVESAKEGVVRLTPAILVGS